MTSRILGYASNTWWRFLNTAERDTRAARFESLLREGLSQAGTPSQKAAWFGTLRNVAITPATVGWLQQVWTQKEKVAGLPLAEADYTALALELAVRQVDGWRDVLQTQLGRIENPDRKGRFQFVMPALSADAAERDRWFASLKEVGNRRREPWVLEGLNYLHHPLRAEASRKHVQASLDLLWEIQKTGDIFFPEALAGRDAGRAFVQGRGRHGARLLEEPAAELSGTAAQHHVAIGRRALSSRGHHEEVVLCESRTLIASFVACLDRAGDRATSGSRHHAARADRARRQGPGPAQHRRVDP